MAQLDKSLRIGEILIDLILEKFSFFTAYLILTKNSVTNETLLFISLKVFYGKLFVRYNFQV